MAQTEISVSLSLDDARVIYRNMKNHFINPDDQRVVYDFVHSLDKLIQEAETKNAREGNLGK